MKRAVYNLIILSGLISAPLLASNDIGYRVFREGYAYWLSGNSLKAYSVFQSIDRPLPPIDDLKLYATAVSALETGRNSQAKILFEKLIAEFPDSPWRIAAEKKLVQTRTPPAPVPEPSDLEERATALFRARDYAKAVPVLEELLRHRGKDDVRLLIMLASAYARSDQYDQAIALQKKIAIVPQEARKAMYKIAFLEADRHHDRDAIAASKEYLNRFQKGGECDSVTWIIAWSYFRLKEWSSAITTFEDYQNRVRAHSEKVRAAYWMARTLELMGNKTGAFAAYGVISAQDASGYYGHLASARLRHKSVAWQLPLHKKNVPGKLSLNSAASVLAGLGLYEFMPVTGWDGDYHDLVEKVSAAYGLTPNLVNAIIQIESHFHQAAVSHAGAIGLMQIIPPTAYQLSGEMLLDMFDVKDLRDPIWNVTLGMDYLRKLSGMYDRHLVAMIAAYNAGEKVVSRWIQMHGQPHSGGEGGTRTALPGGGATRAPIIDPEIFIEEIPYDETYAYVKKVMTLIW